jgi:hypothetical protein
MVETEDIVITSRTAGWANAPLTPIALGLVGRQPTQRRVVTILLVLSMLTFGGTVAAAEASAFVAI